MATTRGSARLHAVLLSHAHGDHIGDTKLKAQEAGTCGNPELVSAAPNSTTGEIVAAKNAAIIMMTPMANFIGQEGREHPGQADTQLPADGR